MRSTMHLPCAAEVDCPSRRAKRALKLLSHGTATFASVATERGRSRGLKVAAATLAPRGGHAAATLGSQDGSRAKRSTPPARSAMRLPFTLVFEPPTRADLGRALASPRGP